MWGNSPTDRPSRRRPRRSGGRGTGRPTGTTLRQAAPGSPQLPHDDLREEPVEGDPFLAGCDDPVGLVQERQDRGGPPDDHRVLPPAVGVGAAEELQPHLPPDAGGPRTDAHVALADRTLDPLGQHLAVEPPPGEHQTVVTEGHGDGERVVGAIREVSHDGGTPGGLGDELHDERSAHGCDQDRPLGKDGRRPPSTRTGRAMLLHPGERSAETRVHTALRAGHQHPETA